jgi:hypothetical protein
MRGATRAVAAVLSVLLCAAVARAGEVAEDWEDGTPRHRYGVDDAGRKEGRYVERFRDGKLAVDAIYRADRLEGTYADFHENGARKTKATYRSGKPDGRFETFASDGSPTELSHYEGGALDGRRQVWRGKALVATQTWKRGVMLALDGAPAFARSREETAATVAKILDGSLPAAPPAKGKPGAKAKPPEPAPTASGPAPGLLDAPPALAADREAALRRARAYRYVCGVPWEDLVAGDVQTRAAQHAALVCAKLGDITHEPKNPGLPPDVYRRGAQGAHESNLHIARPSLVAAVDGWMDDSDDTNVARVGHRRWILSLELAKTGFGSDVTAVGDRVGAMHVRDTSRSVAAPPALVCFPPAGWVPTDMMTSHHAWHASPDELVAEGLGTLRPRVRRLSADFVPQDGDLELEAVAWDPEAIGGRPASIFRPKGVEVVDGAAYVAELWTTDRKSRKPVLFHRWVFAFFGPPAPDAPAARRPADEGDEGR